MSACDKGEPDSHRVNESEIAMNKLERSKLNWALKHLLKESDTDLFPRPFEIEVLSKKWDQIAQELVKIDISSHQWRSPRVALVPKDGISFRRAVQFDPIDAVLFTAVIRTIGKKIEQRRVPESEETVFSYRYKPTTSGKFYSSANAWERFWARSRELARTHGFVVLTDIADFYNQIYHHTIKQELQQSGVEGPFITAIDNLLNTGTQTVSRGLPVGPHGTHLLAELSLIPTDEFLKLKRITFCRYVDDYHIFCNSREDAQVAIFQLADTLDKGQKVLLNRGKTVILTSADFIKRADQMVAHEPINDLERELLNIIKSRVSDPYVKVKLSHLKNADVAKFSSPENISNVVSSYLGQSEPNFVRLRWFLRRLSQIGAPGGVEYVVNNLERLLPAVGDVAGYLKSAEENYQGQWKDIGSKLVGALSLPLIHSNEYLQLVLLGLFSRIRDLNHVEDLVAIFDRSGPLARREVILAAIQAKAYPWLRTLKFEMASSDPWLWRAVLFSAQTFPKDEKDHWIRYAKRGLADLEKAVAEVAKDA